MNIHDDAVHLTRPEAGVAVLTMRRARGPNVINDAFCAGMLEACKTLEEDDTLHAVQLRAEGPTFCVGADIGQMQAHLEDLSRYLGELIDHAHAAIMALVSLPVPVTACVNGVAAGGGFSLALACDRVIAERATRFVVAYPKLGTSPDTGLTHSLSARVGSHRALDILLSAEPIDAANAHRLGLVDELVDNGALDTAGLAAARRLAALPRMAIVATKSLVRGEALAALQARMQQEKEWFLRCADTAALRDRILSFAQRPKPTQPTASRLTHTI